MAPLGHQHVFTGAGSVILAMNATDHLKLAWWGGMPGASASVVTAAFNAAIANVAANSGGTIVLPNGEITVNGALTSLPTNTVFVGAGSNRDASTWSVVKLANLAASYIFKIPASLLNFVFKDFTVDLDTSTTCSALIVDVLPGESVADIVFDGFAVQGTGVGAVPQIYFSPNSTVGEIQSIRFLNGCQFVPGDSTSAIKCGTVNSWMYFQQPKFSMGAGAIGLELDNVGSLLLNQPLFVGRDVGGLGYVDNLNRTITGTITTGTKNLSLTSGALTQSDLGQKVVLGGTFETYIDSISTSGTATVHDAAPSDFIGASLAIYRQAGAATMPYAAIKATGLFTNIALNNSQDEGLQNLIVESGFAVGGVISLNNTLPQAPITTSGNRTVDLLDCNLKSGIINDAPGAATIYRVRGGAVQEITWGTSRVLLKPSIWGVHDGGSFLAEKMYEVSQVYDFGRRQEFGLQTDVIHGVEFTGNPELTKPVLSAGSAFVDKSLLRLGQVDPVSNEWTQYFEMARVSTGHLSFTGNQTGFKGYDFDSVVKVPVLQYGPANIIVPAPTGNVFAGSNSISTLSPDQNQTLNMANPILPNVLFFIQILTLVPTSYDITFGTGFASRGILSTGTTAGVLHTIAFMTNDQGTVAQEVFRTTTQIPDTAGADRSVLTTSGTGLSWSKDISINTIKLVDNAYVHTWDVFGPTKQYLTAGSNSVITIPPSKNLVADTVDLNLSLDATTFLVQGRYTNLTVSGTMSSPQITGNYVKLFSNGSFPAGTGSLYGIQSNVDVGGQFLSAYGGYFSAQSGGSGASGLGSIYGIQAVVGMAHNGNTTNAFAGDFWLSSSLSDPSVVTLGAALKAHVTLQSGLTVNDLRGLSLSGWTYNAGSVGVSYGIYADATIDNFSATRYFIYSLSTSPSFLSGTLSATGLLVPSFTVGSVLFAAAGGALQQDNANLFWDNTNKRFAVNSEAAFLTQTADFIIGKNALTANAYSVYLSHKVSSNGFRSISNIVEHQYAGPGGSIFGYYGTLSNTGGDTTASLFGIRQDITSVTSANFLYGVYSSLKTQSGGNVATARTFQGVLSRVNGAGVIAEGTLFNGLVASGDFTNLYGFKLEAWTPGLVTNSYGIYADATIDIGSTLKYFIYSLSTSPCFFTGKHTFGVTYTPGGTTGAQTINKPSGSVNFAAGATSLVVTNSFCTANSIVMATIMTNDSTLKSVQVVPAAGSFTIFANAAATAETKVGFLVIN
jgi:hypothetical protein